MEDPRISMIDRRPDFFIYSAIAGLLNFDVVVSAGDPFSDSLVPFQAIKLAMPFLT